MFCLPTLRRIGPMIASAALVFTALAGSAHASTSVSVSVSPVDNHAILVDDSGITLYRYTQDQGSTSVCYDSCSAAWPPVVVDALPVVSDASLAQGLGLTNRTDGTTQLTYQGQPLYYFVEDTNPGDMNGQASGGVWFTVDAATGN